RTSVARCNCADSSTSSRRRFRVSISVTGGSESVPQRLLVALEDGDGVLQQRTAVFGRVEEIGDSAGAREQEHGGESAEDRGAVRLGSPQHEREDAEQQAEGHEI